MEGTERTLVILKPDAVQRGLVGKVIQRFEAKGFKLIAMKFMKAPDELLNEHYADLAKRSFFDSLINYMSSGPMIPMIWEGPDAVRMVRMIVGVTDPTQCLPGTIRGDFCIKRGYNVIHGSDSLESAEREIALWFAEKEIFSWEFELSN